MPALRPGARRGAGGKRFRTLDLIEHYWDQIEGDFAAILHGTDARDWIRGTRPWDQFLNYCNTVAQHRGGQLYAAQLMDPRYLEKIKQELAEAERNPKRPGLEGDTAEVEWMRNICNQIRLMTRLLAQCNIEFIDGPEGPADVIKAQYQAASNALVDTALGYPQQREVS